MTLEERLKSSKNNINPSVYGGISKMINDTSVLNVDSIPTRYSNAGKLASLPDSSNLNVDAIPARYNNIGKLTSLPDTSKLNIDKIPSKYAPK